MDYPEQPSTVATEGFKLQTPIKCTIPRRGLLQLNTNSSVVLKPPAYQHCLPLLPISEAVTVKKILVHKGDAQKSQMLTKFPVLMPRRPMELLSEQIQEKKMSCSELQENIKKINVKEYFSPPLSSLSPAVALSRHHQTVHTHSSSTGPLDISITVTRHSQSIDPMQTSSIRPTTNYTPTYTFEPSLNKRRSGSAISSRRHVRPSSGLRQSGGRSCAPLSLNAMVIHQNQPITQKTRLSGKRLLLT